MHRAKKSGNIDNKLKLFQFKSHSNECTLCPANSDLSAKDCISSFSKISDTEQRKVFLQELVLTLDEHELVTLATSLGEKLSKPIRDDAEKMTSKYYNLEELCNYNINDFIQNSNGVLRAFITASSRIGLLNFSPNEVASVTSSCSSKVNTNSCKNTFRCSVSDILENEEMQSFALKSELAGQRVHSLL
jgi:hypothetical protein